MEQSSKQQTRRIPKGNQTVDNNGLYAEQFDDIWPVRMPTSVRRYRSDVKGEVGRAMADVQDDHHYVTHKPQGQKSPVPARRTAPGSNVTNTGSVPAVQPAARRQPINTDEIAIPTILQKRKLHWLVYAVLSLCVMMVGWMVLNAVANWWQITMDDWHYGRPRTWQVDQVVGHNDAITPSHFIALNLNRHVEIIEFPGGDGSKAKIYLGPVLTGPGQDLAPVTLTFKDVNGDHKLDMIVNVQDSHFVFINDNGQFRAPKPGEVVQP